MYTEWRRKMRSGMKHFQDRYLPLYEQTTHFRAYETTYIPDMLSTAGYTTGILRFWTGLLSLSSDVDAAVAARMQRQNLLYAGGRRFEIVIEEQALLTQVGDADIMAGQLDRLLAMLSSPVLTLGVIPARASRHALAQGSFWIFDEARVQVETVSALVAVTQPAEIGLYMQVFQLLQRSAVYGRGARELILHALSALPGS
jgi:hypothetical protein